MFKRRTLFVLGAGASHEVDLPVGIALAQQIRKMVDIRFEFGMQHIGEGDLGLYEHLARSAPEKRQSYQFAGWLIRGGIQLSSSIDDFLDLHQDNEEVKLYGKAATAKCILEAERKSPLFVNRRQDERTINFSKLKDTWYVKFMQMLGRGVAKSNVPQIFDNVSFIVFNYDRCIEQFLRHALQVLYGIQEQQAEEVCRDLHMIHPYGCVGDLPLRGAPGLPFGGHDQGNDYIRLAQDIRTYTEQVLDEPMLSSIAAEMLSAESIVFLGFAFHDQNMRILTPEQKLSAETIFGTAHGMSADDVQAVTAQLVGMFADPGGIMNADPGSKMALRRPKINNSLKCAGLFDYYAKSLTAEGSSV